MLDGDEARHLLRVMRARVGDEVSLFDGHGLSWQARVVSLGRSQVELETDEPQRAPPHTGPAVTLAVALPKGERQKWLVEKLTELGVARLLPVVTERGVAEATPSAIERLRRGVIEACKQCGRDRLMEIGQPISVADILADRSAGTVGLIAAAGGGPLEAVAWPTAQAIVGLVGPEGGFTADELARAEAVGWPRVALGPHVLRVETAAIALAARVAAPSLAARVAAPSLAARVAAPSLAARVAARPSLGE